MPGAYKSPTIGKNRAIVRPTYDGQKCGNKTSTMACIWLYHVDPMTGCPGRLELARIAKRRDIGGSRTSCSIVLMTRVCVVLSADMQALRKRREYEQIHQSHGSLILDAGNVAEDGRSMPSTMDKSS